MMTPNEQMTLALPAIAAALSQYLAESNCRAAHLVTLAGRTALKELVASSCEAEWRLLVLRILVVLRVMHRKSNEAAEQQRHLSMHNVPCSFMGDTPLEKSPPTLGEASRAGGTLTDPDLGDPYRAALLGELLFPITGNERRGSVVCFTAIASKTNDT
jgi:hypothetical protein